MPLIPVKPVSETPAGSLHQIHVNGSEYALCNFEGTLRCFDGRCPHAGGPLGDGNLDGDKIVCPWHSWAFDAVSGVNDFDPAIQLNSYPVEVRDGQVLVDLP